MNEINDLRSIFVFFVAVWGIFTFWTITRILKISEKLHVQKEEIKKYCNDLNKLRYWLWEKEIKDYLQKRLECLRIGGIS